ncbi:MAG: D-alanyl-D-alanine carboxypeptidase [Hyphomicrobiales bacterium]|nr:D-alanyl-D-alanine carboxypeptidase [Hyphomicrobiales bacterium]
MGAASATQTPYLVADVDSGQVLIAKEAAQAWYPASLTKLMTVYVALSAVRDGRLTMDTPFVVSPHAASMPPTKMGFRPGTEVTLDNALKMLMVESPNDVAVTLAEGISGSVADFAAEMNAAAQRLGLHESHFVNPNGLHNPEHVSSARDMAMIARALLREFPDHADIYGIGELKLGARLIRNHNGLIGRYPGADGMKTGFTCPAGFNVVATANHNGRRLIVVVLGSPTAKLRTQEAADLFDRGFAMGGSGVTLDELASSGNGAPPNMRAEVCLRRSPAAIASAEEESLAEPASASSVGSSGGRAGGGGLIGALLASSQPAHTVITNAIPQFDPVSVFVGPVPGWKGPVLAARPTRSGASGVPAEAKAYAAQNPNGVEAAANGEPNAPAALKRAVRTPRLDHRGKLVRHAVLEAKPREKSLSPKGNATAEMRAADAKGKAKAIVRSGAAPAKPSGPQETPSSGQ